MQWPGRGVRPGLASEDIDMARTTKKNDGNRLFINLQGFEPDDDRPEIIVTAQDQKRRQIYSAKVEKDGKVEVPSDVLKKAERFSVGPKDPEGGKALVFRAEQFAAVLERAVCACATAVRGGMPILQVLPTGLSLRTMSDVRHRSTPGRFS